MKLLNKSDPEIYSLIKSEEKRQKYSLMMIPSENIVSKPVEEVLGSCLGNKYAEGYPFKRYYQGQEFVDLIETLAIERAKKAFGVPYANVQPYSGSPANLAVYLALINPGDTIMGLSLAFGGHLTHGATVSATGKYYRSVQYETDRKGYIDYDLLEQIAKRERPKIIVAGVTAYPRIINWKRFSEIACTVNAYLMADISHLSGLVISGAYPSPVPYVDVVTTTTHKTLRGPRGAIIMTTDKGIKKDKDIFIKINKAVFPGLQGGPHINTIAGIAVALKESEKKSFKKYCFQIVKNAKSLAENLLKYDFDLISGGTDSHLILISLRNKNLIGNTVAEGCEAAGIVLNRNSVPFDPNPPFYPSGLRLGTPGVTSRGMREKEMAKIGLFINEITNGLLITKNKMNLGFDDEKKASIRKEMIKRTSIINKIERQVKSLCQHFPIKKTY